MNVMKSLGFFLLVAGGGIVVSALLLLAGKGPLPIFVLAGLGVEVLGLVALVRSHIAPRTEKD